jgi:Ca-activated chloride channel family protein
MKRNLLITVLVLACSRFADGSGLLIPVEPDVPPLALLNHHVIVTIEDQVAVTKVEQTFRNHTDRQLEATYIFPVPEGASVRHFAMWVDGRRVKGELLTADRAKRMYTNIVRQTKNPALLDYVGSDLLSLKIFPIPAHGDQKVEVSFTAVAKKDQDLVEYVYPLSTDRTAVTTLEDFSISITLTSQQPIGSIYSPTHEVTIKQVGDHEAIVQFKQTGVPLDRDFRLFYSSSGRDIGLTSLQQRPISGEDGYAMFLVSPSADATKQQKVPRDIVFVVDTSGSMIMDKKMDQAKAALRQCLGGLSSDDRFALISFATTVNRYRDELVPATKDHVKFGKGWVADLYAGGGTAIHRALMSALEMRSDDPGRMFTIVFLTDGQPTIGETDTDKILADVIAKNSDNTRIFSFGLGNDLNAVFLDQIAERTRALSSYVRAEQDLEANVSSFFKKIHHPVLANLKLSTNGDVRLLDVYPPRLPDLFHGDQLVVLARFQGSGHAAIMLDGQFGMHDKQFVYELNFRQRSEGKPFVEELWARRKVGYLLDQIRINGEEKELVDEVVRMATNYGITTPYTSYLIMPDAPVQLAVANEGAAMGRLSRRSIPQALASGGLGGSRFAGQKTKLEDFVRRIQRDSGDLGKSRGEFQDQLFDAYEKAAAESESRPTNAAVASSVEEFRKRFKEAKQLKGTLDMAQLNYQSGR